MQGYVKSKLTQIDLVDMISNFKQAIKKGYITDDPAEQQWIEEVRQNRDFGWFVQGRRKAQEDYDELCKNLEEQLPRIEAIANPVTRLSFLLPLYERALLLDGKRRGFDITYKQPDNILDFHLEKLRSLVESVIIGKPEELLRDLIALYPHESYILMEMKDFLQLLKKLRLRGMSEDSMTYATVLRLFEEMQPDELIGKCLRIYCRDSLETLAKCIIKYKDYLGEEDEILARLERRRENTKQVKFTAIETVENRLDEEQKTSFREILQVVNSLMYFDSCEDVIRHTASELADYFLRDNIAKTLFELGVVPTPEFTNYPQRFLSSKAEEVLSRTFNS